MGFLTFRYLLESWDEWESDCYPPRRGTFLPCLTVVLPNPVVPPIPAHCEFFPPCLFLVCPSFHIWGRSGSLGYPSPWLGSSPYLAAPDNCWSLPQNWLSLLPRSPGQQTGGWGLCPPWFLSLSYSLQVCRGLTWRTGALSGNMLWEGSPAAGTL